MAKEQRYTNYYFMYLCDTVLRPSNHGLVSAYTVSRHPGTDINQFLKSFEPILAIDRGIEVSVIWEDMFIEEIE
jgi:hypothetical protein